MKRKNPTLYTLLKSEKPCFPNRVNKSINNITFKSPSKTSLHKQCIYCKCK